MTQQFDQSHRVFACIDGSSVSDSVCDYASWIANKVKAPLTLLHTIEQSIEPAVSDFSGAIGLGSQQELLAELTEVEQNRNRLLIEKGRLMLNQAKERIGQSGIEQFEVMQRHGGLTESLIEFENKTRVVVMGIRGEAHEQQAGVGQQLETVIRSLHKPILVVNKAFKQPKKVMLAYDGSVSCIKALNMVAASPLFQGLPCHIVHVGENAQAMLEEAANILQAVGIDVTTALVDGKIEENLVQYQADHDIDLMLMGAFSHHRLRDILLGSFTAKMLAATQKPLLLLR
ncbi:MAG: universal stress protein [Gammaproteobacteria bacterium]|nr:universal stress protein [Gammaproteobacteria bacterium]